MEPLNFFIANSIYLLTPQQKRSRLRKGHSLRGGVIISDTSVDYCLGLILATTSDGKTCSLLVAVVYALMVNYRFIIGS